jgi:UDP-N-acetylglucosamine 1-carboxyvinyltransferase
LAIAALSAEGISIINNVLHIDRGYEALEQKLAKVGANIRRE